MADEQFDVSEELDDVEDESPMLRLVDVWDSSRDPFDDWVHSVSEVFYECEFGIEAAAKLLDTTSGELAAVLSLATMDDESLQLLAEEVPPKTTWFAFSDSTHEEVKIGLEALTQKTSSQAPYSVVKKAIREHRGPTPEERIAELPGEVFFHMATKAKQYDLLSNNAKKFLYKMGQIRTADYDMSPAQRDWAHDLLEELADKGAVSRDSPDDDQEKCDMVLDALDR